MGNYLNRAQRRRLKMTNAQADAYEYYRMIQDTPDEMLIGAGSKVKIKYEQIVRRKDYPIMHLDYRKFVETNKETEFTVLIDEMVHNKYKMVSLKEDTREPRWLFWVGDLEKVAIDKISKV